jgi:hypothetical protein
VEQYVDTIQTKPIPTDNPSQILAIFNFLLVSFACEYGLGRRTAFVSDSNRSSALRLIFTLQVVFYWSITLVKLSVAFLLIRLKPTRRWKIFLYSTITLLLLNVIAQTLFQFLQCRPFSIYWDPSVASQAQCVSKVVINTNIIVNSTIHVTTDLVFSFVPITFIRKLHRPRSEKIFLGVLMGLGLFASTFAILRTAGLSGFYAQNDFFRMNVTYTLWAMLEVEVALVAATIPTLRSFMHKTLVRTGTMFYEKESETQIRGRLVALGFLAEGEETMERKASKPDLVVGKLGKKEEEALEKRLGTLEFEFGEGSVKEKEVSVRVVRLWKEGEV